MSSTGIPSRRAAAAPDPDNPLKPVVFAVIAGLISGWALIALLQMIMSPLPIAPFKVLVTGTAEMLGSPPLWHIRWVDDGVLYQGVLFFYAICIMAGAAPVFARMSRRSVLLSTVLALPVTGGATYVSVMLSHRFGDYGTAVLYGSAANTVGPCLIGLGLRIPTKPAMHSKMKPATCSDFIPAAVPI